jgi:hypothetical protein
MRIALYRLGGTVRQFISSTVAFERGEKDISSWLSKVEKFKYEYEYRPGATEVGGIMEILETLTETPVIELHDVELKGDPAKNIMDTRFLVPLRDTTVPYMMSRPRPDSEIMSWTWYSLCVPQIIMRAVVTAAFGVGKPIHELGERVGFNVADYVYMGFA